MKLVEIIKSFLVIVLLAGVIGACGEPEPTPEEKWETSAHADSEARSFTNWDDSDPPEIGENCAKCHSTTGFLDFLGEDGSAPGQVDQPAPVGTTVECEACHNETVKAKTRVVMPSGEMVSGLSGEVNCKECHQGRASGVQVQEAIGERTLDEVDPELSFINIHNQASGPTQHGTEAMGGYEYQGRSYVDRYDHSTEFNTCTECHDAHTLDVRIESCSACHPGVSSESDLADIRMTGIDYDGDQNVSEGIAAEIEGLRDLLLEQMNLYAKTTEGVQQIEYENSRPYFLGPDGEAYGTWTARLLRVGFNYHYTAKEPAGYAHHGLYHIQLLYDSLEDLNANTRFLTRPES